MPALPFHALPLASCPRVTAAVACSALAAVPHLALIAPAAPRRVAFDSLPLLDFTILRVLRRSITLILPLSVFADSYPYLDSITHSPRCLR